DNKLVAGQDVLAGRPTLLLALALEGLRGPEREELLGLLHGDTHGMPSVGLNGNGNSNGAQAHGWHSVGPDRVQRVRRLFEKAQVFDKADTLVDKFKARAEAVADDVGPTE